MAGTAFTKLSPILAAGGGESIFFHCPGCDMLHGVKHGAQRASEPVWNWNGSVDKPTIQPSILVRYNWSDGPRVCHSFITDGKIQFIGDCTHALAGQTVEIQAFPEDDL